MLPLGISACLEGFFSAMSRRRSEFADLPPVGGSAKHVFDAR
jgi:hypothetical protein